MAAEKINFSYLTDDEKSRFASELKKQFKWIRRIVSVENISTTQAGQTAILIYVVNEENVNEIVDQFKAKLFDYHVFVISAHVDERLFKYFHPSDYPELSIEQVIYEIKEWLNL